MAYGPKPPWGERAPVKVHWPAAHREVYDRAAREAGLSLNEYVIRAMARLHGIAVPDDPEPQLRMSA